MKKARQQEQPEGADQQLFQHEEQQSVRINKYLAASGFCSRRKADELVVAQTVTIDGVLAEMGAQVLPGQTVAVNGQQIASQEKPVYIALHKPIGITCTVERDVPGNIADFMSYPKRIFPIGRLDKDSSGLLLLTSDGDIVNKILRAEHSNEKEYIVRVSQPLTPQFIKQMRRGVEITNMRTKTRETTSKCMVEQLGINTFQIILTQGLNRQIRRMCTELGYSISTLRRVRIMNIMLGELEVGQWRYLTQDELTQLHTSLQ